MDITLTNESTILINYLHSLQLFLKNDFKFSHKNTSSNSYNNLQNDIFIKLEKIYKNLQTDFCNNDYTKYRKIYYSDSSDFKDFINIYNQKYFQNSKYIDNKIIKFIINNESKKSTCFLLKYNLPYNYKTISINFVVYSNFSQNLLAKYDNYITHMLAIIHLITLLTNNVPNNKSKTIICSHKGLSITIFMTPFKKEMPTNNSIIGPNNVNGGFCYGCIDHGEIVIYRSDEFFKVFVHELIHNYGADTYLFKFRDNLKNTSSQEYKIYKNFINNFNLSKEINSGKFDLGFQECVTEFWGNFIHCAVFSYNYSKKCDYPKKLKLKNYTKIFETLFDTEIIHSFLQSVKILNNNNLTYQDILSKLSQESHLTKYNKYKETSHVFSYYIFKLFLIYNYRDFLENKFFNSNNNKLVLEFIPSLKNIEKLLNYIKNIAYNKSVIENFNTINEVTDFINEHITTNSNKSSNKFSELQLILKNLRMCALELT